MIKYSENRNELIKYLETKSLDERLKWYKFVKSVLVEYNEDSIRIDYKLPGVNGDLVFSNNKGSINGLTNKLLRDLKNVSDLKRELKTPIFYLQSENPFTHYIMSGYGITGTGSISELIEYYDNKAKKLDFKKIHITNPRFAYFNSFGEDINPFKLKRELKNIRFKGSEYKGDTEIPLFILLAKIVNIETAIENSRI